MTTTVAPDLKPDHTESEGWPTLDRDPAHATRDELDTHPFDPTQGRKIGSDPYDDPTQGRKLGSDPTTTPPTDGRSARTPTTTPPRDANSDPTPTTTPPTDGRSAQTPSTTPQEPARHLHAAAAVPGRATTFGATRPTSLAPGTGRRPSALPTSLAPSGRSVPADTRLDRGCLPRFGEPCTSPHPPSV